MCFVLLDTRKASLALATMLTVLPVAASAQPTAVHTLYERQDHRMLPVGTRIYYASTGTGGVMSYVYPGNPVPRGFEHRAPDVVVVSATDPRGADEVSRLKHPAVCCPTKHR